jgi:transcription elongation factor Elf1
LQPEGCPGGWFVAAQIVRRKPWEAVLSQIFHTATFKPDDSPARIREEFACPSCGHGDPGDTHLRITDNSLRIFCTGCGAFITIVLSDEQAQAVRRGSAVLSAIDDSPA